MRVNITLKCTECGEQNYISTKNKRTNPERVELKNIVHVTRLQQYTVKQNNNKMGQSQFDFVFFYTYF